MDAEPNHATGLAGLNHGLHWIERGIWSQVLNYWPYFECGRTCPGLLRLLSEKQDSYSQDLVIFRRTRAFSAVLASVLLMVPLAVASIFITLIKPPWTPYKVVLKIFLSFWTPRYRVPPDPVEKALWLSAIGRPNFRVRTSTTVCAKHFKTEDFWPAYASGVLSLRPNVVPSLFTNGNPAKVNMRTIRNYGTYSCVIARGIPSVPPLRHPIGKRETSKNEAIPRIRVFWMS